MSHWCSRACLKSQSSMINFYVVIFRQAQLFKLSSCVTAALYGRLHVLYCCYLWRRCWDCLIVRRLKQCPLIRKQSIKAANFCNIKATLRATLRSIPCVFFRTYQANLLNWRPMKLVKTRLNRSLPIMTYTMVTVTAQDTPPRSCMRRSITEAAIFWTITELWLSLQNFSIININATLHELFHSREANEI